jgi:hypothetical protein
MAYREEPSAICAGKSGPSLGDPFPKCSSRDTRTGQSGVSDINKLASDTAVSQLLLARVAMSLADLSETKG